MTYSENAVDLIKEFEGCSYTAYQDIAGCWTIGYGCTTGVYQGMTITSEQADAMLDQAIGVAAAAVSRLVTVPVNQSQFDALTSFTYNLGEGALQESTLLRLVNEKDFAGAAAQFPVWDHAGSPEQVIPGLLKRREAEEALFQKPE